MNFIEELGTLALGSRIKNLSELLIRDMAKVYKDHNVNFEPRWFTFFQLMLHRKEVSVTEIARELNQTHPAAVQVIKVLEKKKLIFSRKDDSDHRRRLVSLSRKGKTLAADLELLWREVQITAEDLLTESAPDLLDQIAEVEKALTHKTIYQRINDRLAQSLIEELKFVAFEDKYLEDFKELNEDWLKTYLEITDYDKQILSDPIKKIIQKDGKICLLVSRDEVIGTFALQKISDQTCELSKFTIKRKYRGRKLGQRMIEHAVGEAKIMGFHSILLFTHHKLEEATQLYYKMGFKDVKDQSDLVDKTGRCSMKLKLTINQ